MANIKTKRLSARHLKFSLIPESPGVYIFWKNDSPIYIGKAVNLKNRLKSYFAVSLSPKTARMLKEADFLSFIRVTSELESLLLEAKLIRKFQPKFNSVAKDDKHPIYIRITKEVYPRVITARRIEQKEKNLAFFGPFPSSANVRSVLRLLRRIFPYSEHKIGKRPCLPSHLGLCNPCPNLVANLKDEKIKKELIRAYLINIRRLKGVLAGRFGKVREELDYEMLKKSKEEKYEEAQAVKEQIARLTYITQTVIPSQAFLENPNIIEDVRREELASLKEILAPGLRVKNLLRIECFDVAHLAGENPTASMVTFVGGEPDKNFYRHFRIRQRKGRDDIASLKEVAKRRAKYFPTWGVPDLIIVDGGKTQVAAFHEILKQFDIPLVGIAKREETLVIPRLEAEKLKFRLKRLRRGPALNLVQRVRDEAHRFARRYHHLLVKKSLLAYT